MNITTRFTNKLQRKVHKDFSQLFVNPRRDKLGMLWLKKIFLLILFFISSSHSYAQKKVSKKKQSKQAKIFKPENCLEALLLDSNILNAHVGLYVADFNTKQVIEDYQSNKYFLPASTTKIFTCYAAMKNLGDSLLGILYNQDNDTSITILPTGDPTFLHKDFKEQKLFDFLNKFKKIDLQTSFRNKFLPLGKGWSWNDYEETYMAERSTLPMYGNLMTASIEDDKLKIVPKYFLKYSRDTLLRIRFENNMNSSKNKKLGDNDFYFGKNDFINKKKIEIPFTTNDVILKYLLDDTLHNINKNELSIFSTDLQKTIDSPFYSQPTDSLLKPMMHYSDNFFAEQTLLMASFKKLGYMNDELIIDTLLKNEFKDLPQKPKWVDGSGLSRYNLFTPQDFVFVLNKMKTEFSWNRVSTIFPSGGQGTLKNFYKNYTGKIWAKTGSMSNTFCISGFLKTKTDKYFIFSIMINNYNNTPSNKIRTLVEKYLIEVIEKN